MFLAFAHKSFLLTQLAYVQYGILVLGRVVCEVISEVLGRPLP